MSEEHVDKLIITKNGQIFDSIYDEEIEKWNGVLLKQREIFFYLEKPVVLQKEFNLRDYFKLIENYHMFQLLDPYFTEFLKEYHNCPKENCKDEDIDFLELRRIVEYNPEYEFDTTDSLMFDENKTLHTPNSIDTYIDFHGVDQNGDGIAIEFSPIKNILDNEIRITDTKIMINNHYTDKKDSTGYKFYTGPDNISLFEFIKYVIWELSFCGTPEDRDEKFEKICEDCEKILEY